MLQFKDVNDAAEYFAMKLLESSEVVSTNEVNKERYKNSLGGELIQQFFTITNSKAVIGTYKNHKGFKWWMYGEILSEMLNLDPPIMYKYKPEMFAQHYDLLEDGRMQYTYSNRFVEFNQLVNTYRRLKDNPNSKRCVIPIFMPYDTASDRKDAPCTTQYEFIQRNGKLNMTVIMRSWDFFGGFKTYDFALSSFILQSFCSWLNLEPGNLSFYVNSLHYYNRDREILEALVKEIKVKKMLSDFLIIHERTNINDFYKQLRAVKQCEEAIYNGNIMKARRIQFDINITLFKDMCEVWINKNLSKIKIGEEIHAK